MMQSKTIDWISIQKPEFGKLSDREKCSVVDFALIWSFYEAHYLNNRANMESIGLYVESLSQEVINSSQIQELVEYFRSRYTQDDQFSHRHNHLHMDRSGNPEEVTRMLFSQSESPHEELVGCLGIIFRYRNNLFHGNKWEYGLQEQQENFERSTSLLRWLMEQHT